MESKRREVRRDPTLDNDERTNSSLGYCLGTYVRSSFDFICILFVLGF